MIYDSLGDRMKGYESATAVHLTGRMPIVIRLDGKAFHSYTKDLSRPWCPALMGVMDATAIALCKQIQGAQVAYVQSDEISILVIGYQTITSQTWFERNVQKMVSVSAGIASATFTAASGVLREGVIKPAIFDSRVFTIPESDVCNAFVWRQQDATRNSQQMLARSLYSSDELFKKNSSQLQEMCFQKGHNWNDQPTTFRRGRCIVRNSYTHEENGVTTTRHRWEVDHEIPIFSQDRNYINRFIPVWAETPQPETDEASEGEGRSCASLKETNYVR